MHVAICINLFTHMKNLLCYKVIYFKPNSSRKSNMAAVKTLFYHLIVPINAIYKNVISYCINKMTTYVSSSCSLLSYMFSYIFVDSLHNQWNNPAPLYDGNSAECHIQYYSHIALLSAALLEQHPCHTARQQLSCYCFPAKILWMQMWTNH